jgi:hypothetical protein
MDGARKLMEKRKAAGEPPAADDSTGLASRIAALESRERRMLELIESLASNNQQLIAAIDVLRRRARVALAINAALVLGLVVALVGAYGN